MNRFFRIALVILLIPFALGCGRKRIEDTDAYKELMQQQEEMERKADSIKSDNYRQLVDSASVHRKRLDSLKHITDSLKQQLDKNIQELKNKK